MDGKREPMGEMDLAYDTADACWMAEFSSPRVKSGNQTIRKIDARKE